MFRGFSRLMADDRGATAIEYAFIASLISIMIVSGATMMGTQVSTIFATVAGSL